MLAYVDVAASRLERAASPTAELWRAALAHYRPLIERIISQSERRVLRGEVVPAAEKIVSLFEPHADIIVKGSRDTQYGHKLNLVAGRSGLILDLVIETGNPADSERFLPMLERHIAFYGCAPRQAAADGGYANRHNLQQAKARGVRDMAFHKKAGLNIEDMVRSRWVYRKLRNFRAGIEAVILLPQARLRSGTLHLARARPLQSLRLVLRRRLQPRPLHQAQTGLTSASSEPIRLASQSSGRALMTPPALLCFAALATAQKDRRQSNPAAQSRSSHNKNNALWTRTRLRRGAAMSEPVSRVLPTSQTGLWPTPRPRCASLRQPSAALS